MTLLSSLQTLMQTYGSSTVILVAWLGLLALAMLVFLILMTVGIQREGHRRLHRGETHQSPDWQYQQWLTDHTPPRSPDSPGRHLHGRR
jgi:hypothetical protein